jgi:hypothetical protein
MINGCFIVLSREAKRNRRVTGFFVLFLNLYTSRVVLSNGSWLFSAKLLKIKATCVMGFAGGFRFD